MYPPVQLLYANKKSFKCYKELNLPKKPHSNKMQWVLVAAIYSWFTRFSVMNDHGIPFYFHILVISLIIPKF
jgi:hypothetical protein